MRTLFLLPAAALALSACEPASVPRTGPTEPEISCLTRPGGGCTFDQAPLRVLDEPVKLANRPYTFFPTATPLNFVDAKGNTWNAPQRTLTDGASIPQIFTAIVGQPTSPEYINAAAVHDAYCGIGNEKGSMYHRANWQDVHIMFYDGLIVGGTKPVRAKIMFAAVWLGGPRWPDQAGVMSTQGVVNDPSDGFVHPLAQVEQQRLKRAMRETIQHIRSTDPNLPQLIDYLWWQQREMLAETALEDHGGGGFDFGESSSEPASEPPATGTAEL